MVVKVEKEKADLLATIKKQSEMIGDLTHISKRARFQHV